MPNMDRLGKSLETATESALIERTLNGDGDAFHELVRSCQRNVYLTALSILQNEADAEEVAQEAVLKAFRNLSGFRQESSFRTWLIRITVNEARMRLRKDRRYLFESLDELYEDDDSECVPMDIPDVREIPLQAVERKQVRQAIAKALLSLPPKSRSVVVLRDIEHFSIAETTKILGISESCVKIRLLRGRLRLRDTLAPLVCEFLGNVGTPLAVLLKRKHGNRTETNNIDLALDLERSGAAVVCDSPQRAVGARSCCHEAVPRLLRRRLCVQRRDSRFSQDGGQAPRQVGSTHTTGIQAHEIHDSQCRTRYVARELLNEAWDYQNYPTTRTVDNHILKLRQKLERQPPYPVHFVTLHGFGYKFVPQGDASHLGIHRG